MSTIGSGQRAFSLVRALRRRAWTVAACVVLAAAGAFLLSSLRPNEYTAAASLLFRDPGFDSTLFGGLPGSRNGDPQRQAATNVSLVSLPVVSNRAARRLGGALTGTAVLSKIKIA